MVYTLPPLCTVHLLCKFQLNGSKSKKISKYLNLNLSSCINKANISQARSNDRLSLLKIFHFNSIFVHTFLFSEVSHSITSRYCSPKWCITLQIKFSIKYANGIFEILFVAHCKRDKNELPFFSPHFVQRICVAKPSTFCFNKFNGNIHGDIERDRERN